MKTIWQPLPGHAFRVGAVQLKNCTHIIYGVVSSWLGRANELDIFFECIFAALKIAANLNCVKVAIAAVPEGFPADESCRILLEAIGDFMKNNDKQLDISVIASNDGIAEYLCDNISIVTSSHGKHGNDG